jgi:hypothetical protein
MYSLCLLDITQSAFFFSKFKLIMLSLDLEHLKLQSLD